MDSKYFEYWFSIFLVLVFKPQLGFSADPTPPIWASQFQVPIWQVITEGPLTWRNTVMFYYDAAYNMSLEVHGEGQHDEYCTSVSGYEYSSVPCSHLVYKDGWRYLIFPQDKLCCRCCSFEQYCSIISPNWLVGATYQGEEDINGTMGYGWLQVGDEPNYYWATIDSSRKPLRYYEYYKSPLIFTNTWNYDTANYVEKPLNQSIFDPPSYCTQDRCNSELCKTVPKFRKRRF